ncbi:regulator of G-protein signaling 21-like [Myripristis murdjan]|uniref:regulator of G-protein signaling 21-like n=1 Tax=Myripristis murdjan TaxID=586833 RepID=UPI00117641D7|nr:regulator of G-protein signaling 21-like [Myripristis murdjan]
MDVFCKTASLDVHETKTMPAWKSRIHNFVHCPSPRKNFKRQSASETSLMEDSLETLLSQKSGQVAFRDFLKSEFCEENLDFWLACEDFKTLNNPDELIWRATNIYEEFVRTESPREINLDFYTREITTQNIQHPSPSCFALAQKKIYSLMENDSFPRFIKSDQYKDLLDAAAKPRSLGKHRKAFKMKIDCSMIQNPSACKMT